ncbi:nmrA-like family domain-containing protein 1, partial [Megalops cyprinoides]|uniref:nmrA-like family domain-containing protein 1 n=1 Tax=Megalops cyprinoides TaxID=118141 RepID=UPI001863C42C
LDSATGLQGALSGAHKCFFTTRTDFTDPDPLQREISQGYLIADACKQNGINHVVFEGSHHVHRRFGFPVRSMDAKACINDYMGEIGIPKTQLLIPFLYESFLTTFRPKPAGLNLYKIDIPMGETAMDSMSLRDLGPIVTAVLKNAHKWMGKSCALSANRLTIQEYADTLTQCLPPRVFQDSRQICNMHFRLK